MTEQHTPATDPPSQQHPDRVPFEGGTGPVEPGHGNQGHPVTDAVVDTDPAYPAYDDEGYADEDPIEVAAEEWALTPDGVLALTGSGVTTTIDLTDDMVNAILETLGLVTDDTTAWDDEPDHDAHHDDDDEDVPFSESLARVSGWKTTSTLR